MINSVIFVVEDVQINVPQKPDLSYFIINFNLI